MMIAAALIPVRILFLGKDDVHVQALAYYAVDEQPKQASEEGSS